MNKKNSRPPYVLLPMLLVMTGFWMWNLGVFSGGSPLAGGLFAPANPDQVEEAIRAAVVTQRAGDTRNANAQLLDAARTAGGRSADYVFVAHDLIRRGGDLAAPAVTLLNGATRDKDLAWDPLLWANLGAAYRKADDGARAAQMDTRAEQAAATLFGTIGSKPASTNDQKAKAERLAELGTYYTDFKKDPERAIQVYRAAYDLAPDDAGTLNNLGFILADKGTTPAELTEGLKLTERAAQLKPSEGNILDSYGWALFKTGDLPGARRVLSEAAGASPNQEVIHFHLGSVYAKLDRIADAALEFDRATALDPDFADADQARKALPPVPVAPVATPRPNGLLTPVAVPTPTPSAKPTKPNIAITGMS